MGKKRVKGTESTVRFSKQREEVKRSMQLVDYEEYYVADTVIRPLYEPKDLLNIVEESSYLKPHIATMATNIAKFGHGIRYKDDFDFEKEMDEEVKKEALREMKELTRVYKYINPTEQLKGVLEKMIIDRESIGWGSIEIIRDGLGQATHLEHIKSSEIRICRLTAEEEKLQPYTMKEKDELGNLEEMTYFKRFRKFVQKKGTHQIYFKEFGDPRFLNAYTGKYTSGHNGDEESTELAFFTIYSPLTPYGVPRWTGPLVDILGNRASEELNLTYFDNGTILPFAITVDGGQLTNESLDALREGKGIEAAYKILLLETAPFEEEEQGLFGKDGRPKVNTQVHKLADSTNKDGLFNQYQTNAKEKVRNAFRLPPIFTGESLDYTRATAEVAKQIAEEQIFESERDAIMGTFNIIINNERSLKYVEVYLKGPSIGDVADKADALIPFIEAGAVSPNMLIDTLGELLGKKYTPFPDDIGSVPIELIKISPEKFFGVATDGGDPNNGLAGVDDIYEMRYDILKHMGVIDDESTNTDK